MRTTAIDITRALRAAWAYSLLDIDELVERTDIPKRRLKSLMSPSQPSRAQQEEISAISKACYFDSYIDFMLDHNQLPDRALRLRSIDRRRQHLEHQLVGLCEEVRQIENESSAVR